MDRFRAHLRERSWLVGAVVLAALGLRLLMPQGYMPQLERGSVEILVCNATGHAPATTRLDIPVPPSAPDAAERCAYADLAVPLLGSADPVQLALALAFVLALWLTFSGAIRLRPLPHLRPPLRGPPATA